MQDSGLDRQESPSPISCNSRLSACLTWLPSFTLLVDGTLFVETGNNFRRFLGANKRSRRLYLLVRGKRVSFAEAGSKSASYTDGEKVIYSRSVAGERRQVTRHSEITRVNIALAGDSYVKMFD